jgi:hypothetical protein
MTRRRSVVSTHRPKHIGFSSLTTTTFTTDTQHKSWVLSDFTVSLSYPLVTFLPPLRPLFILLQRQAKLFLFLRRLYHGLLRSSLIAWHGRLGMRSNRPLTWQQRLYANARRLFHTLTLFTWIWTLLDTGRFNAHTSLRLPSSNRMAPPITRIESMYGPSTSFTPTHHHHILYPALRQTTTCINHIDKTECLYAFPRPNVFHLLAPVHPI